MKDKLRELAEWMRDVNGHCADALTKILDAEGDGGAVGRDVLADGVRARNIEITRQQRAGEPNNEDHALRIGIAAALATHPHSPGAADSGRVTDEVRGLLAYVYGMGASHGHHYTVEGGYTAYTHNEWRDAYREAIDTAIDEDAETFAALAAQGQGEAVAKVRHFDYRGIARNGFSQEAEMLDGAPMLPDGTLLYTAPPASPAELAAEYTRGRSDGWDAAKATPPAGVPDGWALVPREPTDAMLNAFMTKAEARNPADTGYAASKRWAATLAAAPSATPEGGEVPDNCRQRFRMNGKPYPRSGCAACGKWSPRHRECDAALAAQQPTQRAEGE